MRGKKHNCKYDIRLIENERQTVVEVKARDESSVLTALAVFVNELKEHGNIEEDKLRYACDLGLGKKKSSLKIQEIHISKENEEKFKELLEKMMKGDK
jgi:hypothetical protein